jgi:2-keto-4-pentenoate hydratase/2-oxohepta-3-ene-1,7-dioic acid hydratase in catechol pathway
MAQWVRFEREGVRGFGLLEGASVVPHGGDMFADAEPSGDALPLDAVKLLTPVEPSKLIVMFNNSHAIIARKKGVTPEYPLFFLKPSNSFLGHSESIRLPGRHTSRVVLEGELGVVIGKPCKDVSREQTRDYIFGYTCVNDVTAQDILEHPTLPQHVMSKAFDTFGVFGPAVTTGLQPEDLVIESHLNGRQCQRYAVDDLVFGPYELVSYLSSLMTLNPGDIISCGTSIGVEPIQAGDEVTIRIDGIGSLTNTVV